MGIHVLDAGRPRRKRGEPVTKGLDGARRSPESARFTDGERQCVAEYDGAGQPGGTGYFSSGNWVIQTTKLALRRYLAEEAFGCSRLRGFHRFAARHV